MGLVQSDSPTKAYLSFINCSNASKGETSSQQASELGALTVFESLWSTQTKIRQGLDLSAILKPENGRVLHISPTLETESSLVHHYKRVKSLQKRDSLASHLLDRILQKLGVWPGGVS